MSHSQKGGRSLDNSCSARDLNIPVAFRAMQGGAIDFLHNTERVSEQCA